MAKVLITESTLEDIADAIRVKTNTNRTYKPSEMAIAIYNLDDIHQPIEINVPQSENQTVSVNAKLFSASDIQTEHTTSFSVNFPPSIPITASITPDTGYESGTLNQSSVNAFWGGTINFAVTEASVSQKTIRITFNAVPEEYQSVMPQDYVVTRPYGTTYDISMPVLDHFTPSHERITGTLTDNETFTVTYTRNSANCTLRLYDQHGYSMEASYSGTIGNLPVSGNALGQLVLSGYYGEQFSITFTPPEGYIIQSNPITGTLNNRTYTVRFAPAIDVINDL